MGIRKKLNKFLSPIGMRLEMVKDRREYNLGLYQRYNKKSLEQKKFLNVGAGNFKHIYWTNVDKLTDYYKTDIDLEGYIEWDLLSGDILECEDSSVEIVYTSHTLEHVTDAGGEHFFSEAFRVLKRGGVLRVVLPDMELAYDAYVSDDVDFFSIFKLPDSVAEGSLNPPLYQIFLHEFATCLSTISEPKQHHLNITQADFDEIFNEYDRDEAFNYFIDKIDLRTQEQYPGNHINWYTRDKVRGMLEAAGFVKTEVSGFGQSKCAVLRDTEYFDKKKLHRISMFIEAKKM